MTGLKAWKGLYRGVSRHSRQSLFAAYMSTKVEPSSTTTATATNKNNNNNIVGQAQAASLASAAVVAAAAVNAAVSMRPISAPESAKSFVSKDAADLDRVGKVDEVGLPLIYDKQLIEVYWKKQGSALTSRWTEFLGYTVPFLTKVITLLISGGSEEVKANGGNLAKDARVIMEKLVSQQKHTYCAYYY